MFKLIPLMTATALVLSIGMAHAAETKQQSKMASCSAEFKTTGKDGKERQAYMKECLSNKPEAAATQQGKMASCSTEFKATGKAGKERQAYMKECLSNKPEAKADAKPAATMAKAPAAAATAAAAPAAPKK